MDWLPDISRVAVGMAAVWLAAANLHPNRCEAAGLADLPISTDSFPNLDAIKTNAVAGNTRAQFKLGDYYFSRADFTNAVVWYRKAAEQGHRDAQLSLSSCYTHGRGVARDSAQAYHWSKLGGAQPSPATGSVPPPSNRGRAANEIGGGAPTAASAPPVKPSVASSPDTGGRMFTLDRVKPQVDEVRFGLGSYDRPSQGGRGGQQPGLEVVRDTTLNREKKEP